MSQTHAKDWYYLPLTPPFEITGYEVACFDAHDIRSVLRCRYKKLYRDLDIKSGVGERCASNYFFIAGEQEVSLADRELTPYAWRPIPTIEIPPRK